MNQILIFSENQALIKLWSDALSSDFHVSITDTITSETVADAIIIDTNKIEAESGIYDLFSKKSSRFLIIGDDWSEQEQINALVHGAAGYCAESAPPTLLLHAIKSVLKGDIWIQRHLVPKVIGTLIQMKTLVNEEIKSPESIASIKLLNSLSNRELDVAKMIRNGENNKTIASNLNISERTVKAHLTSAFKKLNVPDRLHLALFIKEFG